MFSKKIKIYKFISIKESNSTKNSMRKKYDLHEAAILLKSFFFYYFFLLLLNYMIENDVFPCLLRYIF